MAQEAVIQRGCVYPKPVFLKLAGGRTPWTDTAWKTARRNGLRTVETAGRAYVTGDDFHDYIDRIAAEQKPASDATADLR